MSQEKADTLREDGRPDPESLLTRYNLRDEPVDEEDEEEEHSPSSSETHGHHRRRGRLRVYLAAVAGSGKTYAMLAEGHRREARKTDIVVGYVETHKRPQTEAMLGDLEVIPRKKVT